MAAATQIFDLEECCLFLSSFLTGGREQVKARLDQSLVDFKCTSPSENISFPVYWRSPLLVKDLDTCVSESIRLPSSSLVEQGASQSICTKENDSHPESTKLDVMFVDVTFFYQAKLPECSQDEEDEDPKISMACGAMVRQANQGKSDNYFYVRGPTVTTQFLREHMEQHDIILNECKPLAIAKEMALALQNLPVGLQAASTFNQSGIQQVSIPLSYENGEESSLLYIVHNHPHHQAMPLDPCVVSTWLGSIVSSTRSIESDSTTAQETKAKTSSPGNGDSKENKKDEAEQLLQKFQQWKQQALEKLRQAKAARINPYYVKKKRDDEDSSNAINASNKRSKPNIVRPGAMRVGGNRNKKAKKNLFMS